MNIQSPSLFAPYAPSQAALGETAATSAPSAEKGGDPLKAAQKFESVFLTNFLSSMFTGISTEAPFGGGQAEETWRGFLIKEYADQIVATGGIGITDAVHRQLISLQEETEK